MARMDALDDELEQLPHNLAALLRAGCSVMGMRAALQRGNCTADDSVPGASQDF